MVPPILHCFANLSTRLTPKTDDLWGPAGRSPSTWTRTRAACRRTREEKPAGMRGEPRGPFCRFARNMRGSEGVKVEAWFMLVHWAPSVAQVAGGICHLQRAIFTHAPVRDPSSFNGRTPATAWKWSFVLSSFQLRPHLSDASIKSPINLKRAGETASIFLFL